MIKKSEKEIMEKWEKKYKKPLVSICCTTYNHEKYIEQALDSFLMQETNFPFEIIVRDDASTDNTPKIIKEYERKYPHIIKAFYEKENQYSKGIRPLVAVISKAKGKYIALCEGDDYWIDKYKLKKQVDFLEKHKEFSMCFHNVYVLNEETGKLKKYKVAKKVPEITSIYRLALGNYIPTCSVVFRNGNRFKEFPYTFNTKIAIGDYFLHMLNARYGYIKKFKEYMGVYRIHESSTWSRREPKERIQSMIFIIEEMKKYFDPEIQKLLEKHQCLVRIPCLLEDRKLTLFFDCFYRYPFDTAKLLIILIINKFKQFLKIR